MPQHMRVSLEAEARRLPRPFHHSSKPRCGEWCPALAGEHKWRLRVLLTLQPSERPQFIPPNWVRARRSTLDPAHREGRSREVDLIPSKVSQFARPEPVAIGHRDHGGVTVPPAIALGRIGQRRYLGIGEIFPAPQFGIGASARDAELVSEKPQTVEKAT